LDTSDWFVLLLSPDAAESEWVNQEVEYWLEHKDSGRIIPVVTDGEFTWSETDIDLESTAAPPALYGAFSDEPRWVDLRFARSEEQLDLNNPRFSAAVADVASAIRQVPKDELESEEVRQHRRTVRTAWAAGAVVLVLAVLAGTAALFALDQRNDAVANATRADQNAAEADQQRQIAEESATAEAAARQEAEAQRAEAEKQAAVAQARELTLEAEKALEFDPELSALLALSAVSTLRAAGEDSTQAESALREAIASDRVVTRMPGGEFVAVHPDGTLLATRDGSGIGVRDWQSGTVVEQYGRPDALETGVAILPTGAAFSPDGNLLAAVFAEATPPLSVWNRTTGESFTLGAEPIAGVAAVVFSRDGELLAFRMEDEVGVEVWSVTERRLVYQTNDGGNTPDFNADGLMSYAVDSEFCETCVSAVRVVDPLSGRLVHSFSTDLDPLYFTAWSPDGTRIAAGNQATVVVFDVATGDEIARTVDVGRPYRPEWLPSGDAFVVGSEAGAKVIDASTGEVWFEFIGVAGGTWDYDVVPGTTSVAIAYFGHETAIFDTAPLATAELGGWLAPLNSRTADYVGDGDRVIVSDHSSYVGAGALSGSDKRFIAGDPAQVRVELSPDGRFVASLDPDGTWVIRVTNTGEVLYRAPEGLQIRGVSPDGTQAVLQGEEGCRLVSTADGSIVADLAGDCFRGFFSHDGSLVFMSRGLYDTSSGDLLGLLEDDTYDGWEAAFTPDGTKVVQGTWVGDVYVFDVAALAAGAQADEVVIREISAHEGGVMRVKTSPDGSMAASWSWTEPLKVWDLDTGQLVAEFGGTIDDGLFHGGDFHPSLPQLVVVSPPNVVRIHTLDLDELITIAEAGLSREMTESECLQYFREPCP
jgi:WD40 repeat protein